MAETENERPVITPVGILQGFHVERKTFELSDDFQGTLPNTDRFAVEQTKGKGGKMQDLKTTVTGFMAGTLGLLSYYGIVVPEFLLPIIVSVGVVALGYFSRDRKKAGQP